MGQGTILFNNFVPQAGIDAPVRDVNSIRVEGTAYLAQLYVGIPGTTFITAVGVPVTFGTGAGAGYFDQSLNFLRVVPFAPPGTDVFIQVRAWSADGGNSWEEARNHPGAQEGQSNFVFGLRTGDGGNPTPITGLNGFPLFSVVIPEPSTWLFFGLGVVTLGWTVPRRRAK